MTLRHLSASGASLVLHAIIFAMLAWLPWGAAPRKVVIGYASAIFATPAAATTGVAGQAGGSGPAAGGMTISPTEIEETGTGEPASEFHLPGFTFDFRKVARRATSLFPFLTGPPKLGELGRASSSRGATGLVTPIAAQRERSSKPPLVMSDAELQSVIDNAWARRDRWTAFQRIVQLLERHHPDDGRLPVLLKAYLDQNLLQPYVDTTIRDPRLWTMLGIAADNVDFVEFIEAYVVQHPGTRTATELLFLLDELAQGSHDGLVTLVDTNVERDLWWTRQTSREAYDLGVRIQSQYRLQLAQKGLTSGAGLRAYYDEVRLGILGAILRTTPAGYRASDARFLVGSIYWKRGRPAEAVRVWREITVARDDSYRAAYADILDVLGAGFDPAADRVAAARIDGILAAEHQRWLKFSDARLKQFGYAVDSF
jgi:hypothetical protein